MKHPLKIDLPKCPWNLKLKNDPDFVLNPHIVQSTFIHQFFLLISYSSFFNFLLFFKFLLIFSIFQFLNLDKLKLRVQVGSPQQGKKHHVLALHVHMPGDSQSSDV